MLDKEEANSKLTMSSQYLLPQAVERFTFSLSQPLKGAGKGTSIEFLPLLQSPRIYSAESKEYSDRLETYGKKEPVDHSSQCRIPEASACLNVNLEGRNTGDN